MILQQNNNEMAGIYLICKNTCQFESPKNFGVSHLLEHMICNSYEHKQTEYSRLALNTNAFTSNDYVCFFITGLHDILKAKGKEFFDLLYNYVPTYEHFAKEMPIVCQEYDDYFSNPVANMFGNLYSKKMGRIYPIGTRAALSTIEFEDIKDFYEKYYTLSEVIIVNKYNDNYDIHGEGTTLIPKTYNTYFDHYESCPINEASEDMVYINKEIIPFTDDAYLLSFISRMLSEGLDSPLYKVVREEKGLVYGIYADDVQIQNLGQLFAIATSSHKDKKSVIEEAIRSVINNPDKYMTKDRFTDIHENSRISRIINEQNPTNFNYLSYKYINDSRYSVLKNLEKITYENVMDYYNRFILTSDNYEMITHSEVNNKEKVV